MADYKLMSVERAISPTPSSQVEESTLLTSTSRSKPRFTQNQKYLIVILTILVLLAIFVPVGVFLNSKNETSAESNVYENCKCSVIGSGWGGVYFTYRVSLSESAIWDIKDMCIFEVSKHRVGGRAYSYAPGWEDLKVDVGAYRHATAQELVGGVIHNILNLPTVCYPAQSRPCNYSAPEYEVIKDAYGNNAGYVTGVEELLDVLYSKGLPRVFMDHELVNVEMAQNGSHLLKLTFQNGAVFTSEKVFLNVPEPSIHRLLPTNLILTHATNSTLAAIFSPQENIGTKQYIRYDDAWWLTKLNYSYGQNSSNETSTFPPISGMRYFDGPVKCRMEGENGESVYSPDRIIGGNCWGALLTNYQWRNQTNANWYRSYATAEELETDVIIHIDQHDPRADILNLTHQKLMRYHNTVLRNAGIDPNSIALPTSTIIAIWDSVNVHWNYPSYSSLIDPATGSQTEDADWKIRNQVLIPVEGFDLFIGNEAWSSSNGWAEGSLILVERLLAYRFGFSKPSYVSDFYWSDVVTPNLPPPQECFLNTDCPPSTSCVISSCSNGACRLDVLVNETCNDGNTCTNNDRCSISGICEGLPIECSGIDICVEGVCMNPDPPALPTCSYTNSIGPLSLYWNWLNDTAIRIAFSLPGSSYIGLGLGSSMASADIWIGYVNNDKSFGLNDYYAVSSALPGSDTSYGGRNDLTDIWAAQANGVTTVWFTRLLNTTDLYDTIITKSTVTDFIYSWKDGTPGSLTYHGDNKNQVSVDMSGC